MKEPVIFSFLNTVGGRLKTAAGEVLVKQEKLGDYTDLLAWSEASGILTVKERGNLAKISKHQPLDAEYVRQRATALREAIYRIFLAIINNQPIPLGELALLNQESATARQHRQLVARGKKIELGWVGAETALDKMIWEMSERTTDFLAAGAFARLRQCQAENCGRMFFDTSKGGRRQWCAMKSCGNLAKVRRFRARQQIQKD